MITNEEVMNDFIKYLLMPLIAGCIVGVALAYALYEFAKAWWS